MTDRDAWIWSMMRAPRDDTLRGVAADWFEERGEYEFAKRLRRARAWEPLHIAGYSRHWAGEWGWVLMSGAMPGEYYVRGEVWQFLAGKKSNLTATYPTAAEALDDLSNAAELAWARLPVATGQTAR